MMYQRFLFWVMVCCLPFGSIFGSGQSGASGPPVFVRDSRAETLLIQALNAAGGQAAIGGIRDFTGTGDITYYWARKAVQGDVMVRNLGLHQFRLDANLPDGPYSTVINGQKSFRKGPNGNISTLPSKIAVKIAATTFPSFQVLTAVQDKSTSISAPRLVAYDGEQTFEIVVKRIFPAKRDPVGVLGSITKTRIYIDPKNLIIRGIRDAAYSMPEGRGEAPHEIQFSDYRVVDSVLAPMLITELIAGQRTMTIQLRQINFNTGLTDADFK